MDTVVSSFLTSIGVTIVSYGFKKFGVGSHAQRAIVFALSCIGALIQLAILHKLGFTGDPATWYVSITSVLGGAQGLYSLMAPALGLGKDGQDTPPVNPT